MRWQSLGLLGALVATRGRDLNTRLLVILRASVVLGLLASSSSWGRSASTILHPSAVCTILLACFMLALSRAHAQLIWVCSTLPGSSKRSEGFCVPAGNSPQETRPIRQASALSVKTTHVWSPSPSHAANCDRPPPAISSVSASNSPAAFGSQHTAQPRARLQRQEEFHPPASPATTAGCTSVPPPSQLPCKRPCICRRP